MNRTQINQTYYLKNQVKLKEQRRLNYQQQKSQGTNQTKKQLADYYHANNIKVLISLKDYVENSPENMKLWYRFSSVLSQIKEGVADIIEIMRLREVMSDLISDYWSTAKKPIKITKKWNKLTSKQQAAKKKLWEQELKQEENELLNFLEQQEESEKTKQQVLNDQEKPPKNKVQCPDCNRWVKELDEENDICLKCLKNYE